MPSAFTRAAACSASSTVIPATNRLERRVPKEERSEKLRNPLLRDIAINIERSKFKSSPEVYRNTNQSHQKVDRGFAQIKAEEAFCSVLIWVNPRWSVPISAGDP